MEIGEPLKRWEVIPLTEPVPGAEPQQPQAPESSYGRLMGWWGKNSLITRRFTK